eukprot:TRINITY_DN5388_c0_g1_i1.p1 TRINITY_DN5388_c0_g1~~TRINITY_DN5388_c0_g1_i1.p1  ORF type:complete len:530 (-),score=70.61 TRINITY_DN5388_c0_g1_i1:17-1606(-)
MLSFSCVVCLLSLVLLPLVSVSAAPVGLEGEDLEYYMKWGLCPNLVYPEEGSMMRFDSPMAGDSSMVFVGSMAAMYSYSPTHDNYTGMSTDALPLTAKSFVARPLVDRATATFVQCPYRSHMVLSTNSASWQSITPDFFNWTRDDIASYSPCYLPDDSTDTDYGTTFPVNSQPGPPVLYASGIGYLPPGNYSMPVMAEGMSWDDVTCVNSIAGRENEVFACKDYSHDTDQESPYRCSQWVSGPSRWVTAGANTVTCTHSNGDACTTDVYMWGGCFPGSAQVLLESGEMVEMENVRVGDSIQCFRQSEGVIGFCTVATFAAADPSSVQQRFVHLHHSDGEVLVATADHYVWAVTDRHTTQHVYSGDLPFGAMRRAVDIQVGDMLVIVSGNSTTQTPVTSITSDVHNGMYAPVTTHGSMPVVDGVVASGFAVENPFLNHYLYAPMWQSADSGPARTPEWGVKASALMDMGLFPNGHNPWNDRVIKLPSQITQQKGLHLDERATIHTIRDLVARGVVVDTEMVIDVVMANMV